MVRGSVVYSAARHGYVSRLQSLMNQQMNDSMRQSVLEYTDEKGRTPLIIAAQKGHLSCVLELLNNGANVHHMSNDDFGGTALHVAVYYKWRSNGIVEALLRHGANPFVKNKHNRTALQLAMIENAPSHLYIPWLITFDRYGYYAEELMVLTSSLTAPTAYVSRWVTVVPLYSTSDPSRMQSQRKLLMIYDGHMSRDLVSQIDLTHSNVQWSRERNCVILTLGRFHSQPSGVSSMKNTASSWTVYISSTDADRIQKLNSFIQSVNGQIQTIMNRQLTDALYVNNVREASVDETEQIGSMNEVGLEFNALPSGDDGVCVVCLDRPQTSGFLHGDSVHYCVCETCAYRVFRSERNQCPICRRQIERIVKLPQHSNNGVRNEQEDSKITAFA
eukprot:g5668.t1